MVKKLDCLPLVGKIVRDFNEKSLKLGYQGIMREILTATGTKLKVFNKNRRLKSILKSEPVIVVSNHPAMTDVVVLTAAQEPREDSFLIISSNFLGMLSNIDNHLIPVHINYRLLDNRDKLNNLLLRIFRKIHSSESLPKEVSHLKNIESINKAASIVKNGGMVSMFPGGGGKKGKWFSGIGYLIKSAMTNRKTKIIMAHLSGTSEWDYFRLIPGVSMIMPQCRVTFSEGESILNYSDMEPKEIVERIKNKYLVWEQSLPKKYRWWERIVNKIPSVPENAYYLARCMVLWIMTRTMS
ncbi:MAG: hypothetical protein WC841_00085 [Candidatus Shapirobacteria bacterium]|jgi:hypothetical protein